MNKPDDDTRAILMGWHARVRDWPLYYLKNIGPPEVLLAIEAQISSGR